eukprot:11465720-Alexandrium_andersonii.AAC.1
MMHRSVAGTRPSTTNRQQRTVARFRTILHNSAQCASLGFPAPGRATAPLTTVVSASGARRRRPLGGSGGATPPRAQESKGNSTVQK